MKVFVYYNLHKKMWSVKALEGERKGRVIIHCHQFTIGNCVFKVSEAGRKRVLREKRKNVHAGIVGEWLDIIPREEGDMVSYNPYNAPYFYDVLDKGPVYNARVVHGIGKQVFYS